MRENRLANCVAWAYRVLIYPKIELLQGRGQRYRREGLPLSCRGAFKVLALFS